jgi:hypothetical protein
MLEHSFLWFPISLFPYFPISFFYVSCFPSPLFPVSCRP